MAVKKDKLVEGYKADEGKGRWDLADFDTLAGMVDVLTFGVIKYEDRNWEKGMKFGRIFASLMRHLTAWWMAKLLGNDGTDPETGYSHLSHAQCCLHFLATYERREMWEFDDRPSKD